MLVFLGEKYNQGSWWEGLSHMWLFRLRRSWVRGAGLQPQVLGENFAPDSELRDEIGGLAPLRAVPESGQVGPRSCVSDSELG